MAPPSTPVDFQYSSTPLQVPPAPFASLPCYGLHDKHRKSREHQGVCGFLSLHPLTSSLSPDSHPPHCHEDDLSKPKGKRPCKTKHTEGEIRQDEAEGKGAQDEETKMVRKIYLHKPTDRFDYIKLVTVSFWKFRLIHSQEPRQCSVRSGRIDAHAIWGTVRPGPILKANGLSYWNEWQIANIFLSTSGRGNRSHSACKHIK